MKTTSNAPAKIVINYDWCKKCGICIAFCPVQVFETGREGEPVVARPEKCIKCLLCEKRCPDLALSVGSGKSE